MGVKIFYYLLLLFDFILNLKMSEFDFTCFLLCYKRFSPFALELSSSIISLIGGIITYCGLLVIPFRIDSRIYKILFFINIPYFILIIILNILFMVFRRFDLIKNELYSWSYGLSIVEIYVSLFGIITNMLNDAMVLSNMGFYQTLSLRKKSDKYPMITPKEWLYTKIIFPIILLIWLNMLLMNLTDNLLINLKINDSYHMYELALKEEKEYSNKEKENDDDNDNNNGKNHEDSDTNNQPNEKNIIRESTVKINNNYTMDNKENKKEDNKNNNKNNLKSSNLDLLADKNDMNQNLGENEETKN